LIEQVMTAEPYRHARRVFLVVDNGTIHRGQKACDRLAKLWPNLRLVHLPVHASWLNQIEIYFSILARKALTPCHFESLDQLAERVIGFQAHYRQTAKPFDWIFTRQNLNDLVARLHHDGRLTAAA
jgi:transposase